MAVTQHLTLLCIAAVLYMCAGVWLVSHPHRSVLPIALFTLCALSVLSVCACSGARLRTQTAASSGRVWLLNVSSNHRHIAAAAQCAGPLDICVVWMLWCACCFTGSLLRRYGVLQPIHGQWQHASAFAAASVSCSCMRICAAM